MVNMNLYRCGDIKISLRSFFIKEHVRHLSHYAIETNKRERERESRKGRENNIKILLLSGMYFFYSCYLSCLGENHDHKIYSSTFSFHLTVICKYVMEALSEKVILSENRHGDPSRGKT